MNAGAGTHAAGLALLASIAMAAAAAPAGDAARFERELRPGGIGAHRASLDTDLLVGGAPVRYEGDGEDAIPIGGLEDLRLQDAAGREVPYLLMLPASTAPAEISGRLAATPTTRTESGFEIDLGRIERVDRLSLRGLPGPFLKRFSLEGSGDRQRWIVLVDAGTVFDLPDEGLTRMRVDFRPTELRYLRWIWSDATSARAPMPLAVSARRVEDARPAAAERVPLDFERRPSEPRLSRFRVRLPGRNLPMAALEFEVAPGDLSRPLRIQEPRLTGDLVEPVVLARGTLRRSAQADAVATAFSIPFALMPVGDELEVVVDDGDNPPLELLAVRAKLRILPWIYFESLDGRPLTARFGRRSAVAPRYDLEASRQAAQRAEATMATWGPTRHLVESPAAAAPDFESVALGATIDVQRFEYARALPATPAGMNRLALDLAVLAHSGLSDLRIVTGEGQQVPYLLERQEEPLSAALEVRPSGDSAEPGTSKYVIEMPYSGLPPSRLILATSGRVFERHVRVWQRLMASRPPEPLRRHVTQLRWLHADPSSPAPDLVIELPRLATREIEIDIEEGDNQPLPLVAAHLLVPSWRLRFFGGRSDLRLLYGRADLAAPRYDLALLGPRLVGTEGHEVHLGPEQSVGSAARATDESPRLFWILLAVSVLALLALLARLLRGTHPGTPES